MEAPITIEAQIRTLIKKLEDSIPDAQTCDKGRAGAPGTRLRKVASEVQKELGSVRKAVIEARSK